MDNQNRFTNDINIIENDGNSNNNSEVESQKRED